MQYKVAYTIKKFVGKRNGGGWSTARLVPENDDFDEGDEIQ